MRTVVQLTVNHDRRLTPRDVQDLIAEFLSEGQAMVRNADASAFHDPTAREEDVEQANFALELTDSFRFCRPRIVPAAPKRKTRKKKR